MGKLLYVEFIDHGSTSEWKERSDIDLKGAKSDATLWAVGWLLAEDDIYICLGSFLNDDGLSHTRQYIVKAAITKRRVLRVPK